MYLGKSKLGRERAPLKITSVTLLISHAEPVVRLDETTDYEGLEITVKRELSADGQTLTITTYTQGPDVVKVFKRAA